MAIDAPNSYGPLDYPNGLIEEAYEMPPGRAISYLFDHYRSTPDKDSFVLALLADLTARNARRRLEATSPSDIPRPAPSEAQGAG